jgi:outer membrane protein OmpA-like peptidoglycan-associated protein
VANDTANGARTAASDARSAATDAGNRAAVASGKFDAMDKSNRRLVYEVVLNEDSSNFKVGKTDLPDDAKAKIDELLAKLKEDPKNVFIEIEGHTDNTGDKALNDKLGLERAQAVQKYLYEQHQVPLHKISVISYGPDKPVAPNTTRAGRAQNRRVVIKVLV